METAANTAAINNALMGNSSNSSGMSYTSSNKKPGMIHDANSVSKNTANKFQHDFSRTLETLEGATIIGSSTAAAVNSNNFTSHSIANLGLAPAEDCSTS